MDCAHFNLEVRTLKVTTSPVHVLKGTKVGSTPATPQKRASKAEEDEGAKEVETLLPKRRKMPPRGSKRALVSPCPVEEGAGSTKGSEEESGGEGRSGRAADSESSSAREAMETGTETPADDGGARVREVVAELSQRVRNALGQLPDCWMDEEQQVCCFRFNKEMALLPKFTPSILPSRMLASLLAIVYRSYLDSLLDKVVSRVQVQLAVGSIVVARYMAEKSEERRVDGSEHEKLVAGLRAKVEGLEQIAHETEIKMKADRNAFIIREYELFERIGAVEKKEAEQTAEVMKLKEAKKAASMHRQVIEQKIAQLREAATSFTPTLDEAKAVYNKSDAYKEDMGDFGEYGLDLLKKAMLKDWAADPLVIEGYDYWTYIGRAAEEQL